MFIVQNCDFFHLMNLFNINEMYVYFNINFTGGGTGFIGSAFQYLLKKRGYDVTIISRMPGPQRLTWVWIYM